MKRFGQVGVAIATGIFLLVSAPAYAPATETPQPDRAAESAMDCPCDCGCPHCTEKPCGHHGHMEGGGMMPPKMEKMRGHLEEIRKAVADLRESEKRIEGSAGTDPFRSAVLDHLKKVDDLQESHLKHMETMMSTRHAGKKGAPHRHCR